MDKKLIKKMVQNCFLQYHAEEDSLPITEEEFEGLCKKIMKVKSEEANTDLFEIVNDFVYEYLSK